VCSSDLVEDDLSAPGHPDIFVIGDAARVDWTQDKIVPGIAPAAKQEGYYVANVIKARIASSTPPAPFSYRHTGNLATIGRNSAVVDLGWVRLKGWVAWWFWGIVHIFFLINARAATVVMLQWFWAYLTRKRVLDEQLQAALVGDVSSKEAMDNVAKAWRKQLKRKGMDKMIDLINQAKKGWSTKIDSM